MKKILFWLIFLPMAVWGTQKVTLQLSWLHQFQFAGYYVAKEKGFYKEAGLDVTINDAQNHKLPMEAIEDGSAQYAVGHSSMIVDYINGAPIVAMGAIFQSSPMMLLTREDAHIMNAKMLRGKRIMLTNDALSAVEIQAMLRSVGLSDKDIIHQQHSYNPESLKKNETDAMASYLSNEPFILQQKGIATRVLHPKDYGFDFYSDILLSTQAEVTEHPDRARAFYEASLKGWAWAFDHIDETAELIYRKYNPQNKSLESLIYEGKVLKSLAYRPGTALGYIDPKRLEMIAQVYRLMGLIEAIPSLEPLIYHPHALYFSKKERAWLENHPVIRVGIDKSWPPIDYVDTDGKHTGISESYRQLLEERLGIRLEIDYSTNWAEAKKGVENHQLDMLLGAVISDERKKKLLFSDPYAKQMMVIAAASNVGYINDLGDLKGKTIAVVKGYIAEEMVRKEYPHLPIIVCSTTLEALKKVSEGKAYACVDSLNVVSYLIERYRLKNIKVVGETGYTYDLGFAVRSDWPELVSIINKVLGSVTPDEYEELHGRWMAMQKNAEVDYTLVWSIVAVAVVMLLLITYKNRQLDILVRQRTDELESFNQRLQDEIEKAVEKNRKQEKLLMQQAKMAEIGSMLESIAHQWRQPLNILGLSMTRLSLNCAMGGSANDAAKVLEIAEAQIEYMSQTIDDFRNFFKQDRSRISVNIAELVNEVEALLGPLLIRKKITIERQIDPSVEALVYPNELKQVLINIINNAREAIEHHRSDERLIQVRCTTDEHFCTLTIEDTGGGIDSQIMDKIFDPYFTTKFESQGTGIGLYMAKTIIEKHFLGKLSVYNGAKGACFEIRLNRALQAESDTPV